MTFTESIGKTKLHNVIVYASKKGRDGALMTRMTEGMQMGYQKLDALLESLV